MSRKNRRRNETAMPFRPERWHWANFAFFALFSFVLCLSIWQISESPIGLSPSPSSTQIEQQYVVIGNGFYAVNASGAGNASGFGNHLLRGDDYGRLMDLGNFSFNMPANGEAACDVSAPLLLVLVHSSPGNFQKRTVIRETWGRSRENVKIFFLLGAVGNGSLQAELDGEERRFEDLVQGSFVDTYRNMTYKHVMAFKYAIYHCPQAKYILKTDDDIFVNMPKMLDFLASELSANGGGNLLMCKLFRKARALRSFRSKWRVSFKEYPKKFYPDYCPGWALLYTPDVLFALYREAQGADYFWIDDVLITGILAERLGLNHTDAEPLIMSRDTLRRIVGGRLKDANQTKPFLYARPDLNAAEIRALWDFVAGAR